MTAPRNHRVRETHRRGFTLVEVVAASVGMAIVFAASLSLLSIIAGSMPSRASASSPAAVAPAAVRFDRLCEDLSEAVEVIRTNANSFRFRIEDLNADGTDEWFIYSWSGTPGAPLTLARNGLPGATVIENVVSLGVTLNNETDTATVVDYEVLSSEVLMDGVSSMPGTSYPSTLTRSVGFHIEPNLSPGVLRYSIDRIVVYIEEINSDETLFVEIRENDGSGFPRGPIIEQWVLSGVEIDKRWVSFDGRNTREFAPGEGIGLLLYAGNTSNAPEIRFSLGQTGGYMSTTNALGIWTMQGGIQPTLGIFGRETTPATTADTATTVTSSVTLQIGVGDPGSPRTLSRRVVMNKRPEVSP